MANGAAQLLLNLSSGKVALKSLQFRQLFLGDELLITFVNVTKPILMEVALLAECD